MKTEVLNLVRKGLLGFLFSALTVGGVQAQCTPSCQNIVGGTEFESRDAGWDYRNLQSNFLIGPSGGVLETTMPHTYDGAVIGTKRAYIVVDNPKMVNAAFPDIPEPMMIVGQLGASATGDIISYTVAGLVPSTTYCITIEGYLLSTCVANTTELRFVINPGDPAANMFDASYSKIIPNVNQKKFSITQAHTLSNLATGFTFQLRPAFTTWNTCIVLGITKLEIKGCLKIKIKSTEGDEICKGDLLRLWLDRDYNANSYQWMKSLNGTTWTPMANGNTKTVLDEVNETTYYRCTVDGTNSEVFKVTAITCCEIKPGVSSSRKTIYHDNFGTFLAPRSYLDKDGKPATAAGDYQACLPAGTVPGHTCAAPGNPNDGQYVVSTLRKGIMQDWMRGNMTEDASGDPNGAAACINISTSGTLPFAIYRQQIDNLCPNTNLYFECQIANASFINSTAPPEIQIRIEKLDGTILSSVNSALTKTSYGWFKLKIPPSLSDPPLRTTETSVILRINTLTAGGNGWDLLLDDIIFRTCSPPIVELYSDINNLTQDATICGRYNVELATKISNLVDNYYDNAPRFLFQVSTNGTSWTNIGGIRTVPTLSHPLSSYTLGTYVYFRIVVGTAVLLNEFVSNPNAQANTHCKTASISAPIKIFVDCPCPTPGKVTISANKVISNKYVDACPYETITLSVAQPLSSYCEVRWYQANNRSGTTGTPLYTGTTFNVTSDALGTKVYFVKVVEKEVPNVEACWRFDSIFVRVKTQPVVANTPDICITSNPLSPTASDNICFSYKSSYADGSYVTGGTALPSRFIPYKNLTGGTPLSDTIKIAAGGTTPQLCVKGNQVEVDTVTNGKNNPLYHVYLQDATPVPVTGTLLEGANIATATSGGTKPSAIKETRILLEVKQDVWLQSVNLYLQSNSGTQTITVMPVLYTSGGGTTDTPGATGTNLLTTAQSVSFPNTKTKLTINLGNKLLTPGRYYIGFTFSADPGVIYYNTSPVTNSYLFNPLFPDNLKTGGLALNGVGAKQTTANSANYIISDLQFTTYAVTNTCERIKLTVKYLCANCNLPDEANGKRVTITTPAGTKKDGETVILCANGSVDLSVNLKYKGVAATNQFNMIWYKGSRSSTPVLTVNSGTSGTSTYKVTAPANPTVTETTRYYVLVQDRASSTEQNCWVWDSVDVRVNPPPTVNPITDKSFCSGDVIDPIGFSSPAGPDVTFSWTNSNTATGLGASGNGSSTPSFMAANGTNSPISGTITVSPSANGCSGTSGTFKITVNPRAGIVLSSAATTIDQTVCKNSAITNIKYSLSGGAKGATVDGLPAGVTYSVSGSTLTISGAPTAVGTFNYTVETTGQVAPCVADKADGTITVNPPPENTLTDPLAFCQGKAFSQSNWTVSGCPTCSVVWTAGSAPTLDAQTAAGSYPFSYKIKDGDCVGDPKTYTVTVKPLPAAPTISDYISCPAAPGTTKTWSSLVVPSPTGTLTWYQNVTGGSSFNPGNFDASVSKPEITYWVTQTVNGCESSPRAAVKVAINSEPSAPTVIPYDTCALVSGGTKTWASLVNTSSTNLTWYSADNDASVLVSAPAAFNTGTAKSLETYWVMVTDGQGCKSKRAKVTAQIKARPKATLSAGTTSICKNSSASLTVTFTAGTPSYKFTYSDGTTTFPAITTSANPHTITFTPASTAGYKLVSLSDGQCPADITDLTGTPTITVNTPPTVGAIDPVKLCVGETLNTPPPPSVTNYTSTHWEIGAAGSEVSFPYIVSAADNGKKIRFVAENECGPSKAEETITVDLPPTVTLPVVPPFCEGTLANEPNKDLPGYDLTWAAGSAPTVQSLLAAGSPHKFTYTVSSSANCKGEPQIYTIEVNKTPPPGTNMVIYAKADTLADGTFKNLLAQDNLSVIPNSGYTIVWYDSTKTKIGTNAPVPPIKGSAVTVDKEYTYYATQINPSTTCESALSLPITVLIYAAPTPRPHSVSYCEGETPVPLNADIDYSLDPTGNYELRFYQNLTGGVGVPPPFTPSVPLTTGKKTYYVSQKNMDNGNESSRVPLDVTVYANPVITVDPTYPQPVCEGKTVNITTSDVWRVTPSSAEVKYYKDSNTTLVVDDASKIDSAGFYYLVAGFKMPSNYGGVETCPSNKAQVEVKIHDLTGLIGIDTTVCPNTSVTLTSSATSNKPGTNNIRYQWSGHGKSGTAPTFNTGVLLGNVNTPPYTFTVAATAGACNGTASYIIRLDDAPRIGQMLVSEENNGTYKYESIPTKTYPDPANPNSKKDHYSCGNEITIDASNYVSDLRDFEWRILGNLSVIETGPVLKRTPTTQTSYVLSYTNGCAVKDTITIRPYPVTVSEETSVSNLEICEQESFWAKAKINCDESGYTVQWERNDANVTIQGERIDIASAIPSNSGFYPYTVTHPNRGCKVKGSIGSLLVKPNIKFSAVKDTIVERGKALTITLAFDEPVPSPQITWTDNRQSTVQTGNPFTIDPVDRDYDYQIVATASGYCSASTQLKITADAVLRLKSELAKDTICFDGSTTLSIDTTGTGQFADPKLANLYIVVQTVNNPLDTIRSGWSPVGGKLVLNNVKPAETADYKVEFTYKNQQVDSTLHLTVLPKIKVEWPSLRLCEGDVTTMQVTVLPTDDIKLEWATDTTLTVIDDRTVMVRPPYTKSGSYAYLVTASLYGICPSPFYPNVKVDEYLRGKIETNAPVCEGVNVRINAGSYRADTYSWTSTAFNDGEVRPGAVLNELPSHTSDYFVSLTRGVCTEKDSITIEIASKPRIASIDSIGPRSRRITMTPGYGAPPFLYGVDKRLLDSDPEKHDLAFSRHLFYVEDVKGCRSEMADYLVDYPKIFPPTFFTPDGDGLNDRWEIEGMAEIFPDAVIVIYDRYGKKLAEYKGSSDGWDGKYQGRDMPSTDYWYEIRIEEIKKQYVGHFTLLRAK